MECQGTEGTGGQGLAGVTHMGLGAEEVEAVMVDSEDTGGWHQDIAAALDEEEGGAKQGKGTEEACSVESLRSGHQDTRTATALSCHCLQKLLSASACSDLPSSPLGLFLYLTFCPFIFSSLPGIISNPGDTFWIVVTSLSR